MSERRSGAYLSRDRKNYESRRPRMDQPGAHNVRESAAYVAREFSMASTSRGGSASRRESRAIVNTNSSPNENNRERVYANYFALISRPDFHLYQYHVDFTPDVEFTRARIALVYQHEKIFTKHVFDGSTLYSTTRLEKTTLEQPARRSDGSTIMIRYRLVGEVQTNDQVYTQVMNNIVRVCMRKLNLVMIRRDYYDPDAAISINQHHLSVWPGYMTTIHRHDGGYLLNVEIKHKIMRTDTAHDAIKKLHEHNGHWDSFEQRVRAELVGKVVITKYNQKTYRIDDVDFTKNPRDKFLLKKEDREITFMEYFKERWNLAIKNTTQPLLVVRPSRRDVNRGNTNICYLIPELCFMTGLSDEHLRNFHLKNDVGVVTRVNPSTRVDSLMRFRNRLVTTPGIQEELDKWGLKFGNDIVQCQASLSGSKILIRLGNTEFAPERSGWSHQMQKCSLAQPPVAIAKWAFIFPGNMMNDVRSFYTSEIQQVSAGLNLSVSEPLCVRIQSDKGVDYIRAIDDLCMKKDGIQMIVCILRSKRVDHYKAIKVRTLCEFGMLSQVITLNNIKDQRKKMSVATKLMIQIAAKLGGEPWKLNTPDAGWMVIGYDTYHDARQKRAVGAFVASLNITFTKYYSKATIHENNEEIAPNFKEYTMKALLAFYEENKDRLPVKVIVYRDGIGAGDVPRVLETEARQIEEAIQAVKHQTGYNSKTGVSFVIVSKRINTRLFVKSARGYENPPAGIVVDNTVTLPERFDFFLVSQNVNQGTVSPTSYNVILNTADISPIIHQKLAYFLTHLYFNWQGTLNVPAPIQYAHKLAYLCGESLGNNNPSDSLSHNLYYL